LTDTILQRDQLSTDPQATETADESQRLVQVKPMRKDGRELSHDLMSFVEGTPCNTGNFRTPFKQSIGSVGFQDFNLPLFGCEVALLNAT
jgi:hypothetical protein